MKCLCTNWGSFIIDNHCFETDLNTSRDFDGTRVRISVNISTLLPIIDADDDGNCDELVESIEIPPFLVRLPPLLCFVEEDIFAW